MPLTPLVLQLFSRKCEYITGIFQGERSGARVIVLSVVGAEMQNFLD